MTDEQTDPQEAKVKEPGTISARTGQLSGTVQLVIAVDLKDMLKKYGEQAVFDTAMTGATLEVQSGIRRCLNNGSDPQAFVDDWKLGESTRIPAASKENAAIATFKNMDPEKRAEVLRAMGVEI